MATFTNNNNENFGTLSAGGNITVSHWVMRFGNVIAFVRPFETARTFAASDALIVEAGDIDVTLADGQASSAWVKDLLDEYITQNGNPTMSLHTAAPGDAGSASEVPTARGYTRQTIEVTTAAS